MIVMKGPASACMLSYSAVFKHWPKNEEVCFVWASNIWLRYISDVARNDARACVQVF